MRRQTAEIVREYGPFPGVDNVGGVTYDGQRVWFAAGDTLNAFDPASGLLIVSAHDAYGIYFFKPEHGTVGWAGADYTVYGRGVLRAIDYQTGTIRWSHDLSGGAGAAGVLTTASGLTFTGDSATSALALRSSDGATLWHEVAAQELPVCVERNVCHRASIADVS